MTEQQDRKMDTVKYMDCPEIGVVFTEFRSRYYHIVGMWDGEIVVHQITPEWTDYGGCGTTHEQTKTRIIFRSADEMRRYFSHKDAEIGYWVTYSSMDADVPPADEIRKLVISSRRVRRSNGLRMSPVDYIDAAERHGVGIREIKSVPALNDLVR